MAMKTFFVKKGWLIAKDDFGNMLPFFLKVRDKDIVWQSKNNEFIENILRDKAVTNITEISPNKLIGFTLGNWNVEVDYTRRLCNMRTRVDFTSDSFDLNSGKDTLSSNLSLPLTLLDNDKLHIQCHISSESVKVATSSASVCKLFDGVTKMIHNLSLKVFNSTYKFPTTYYSDDAYKFSSIYIEVRGEFTDY